MSEHPTPELDNPQQIHAYIEQAFTRQPGPYTREQIIRWLSWLAKRMSEDEQTVFSIEEVQLHWLQTGAQRWVCQITSGLSVGLAGGLFIGLAGGLFFGLDGGLYGGLFAGLMLGLGVGLSEVEPSETLQWSWGTIGKGLFGRILRDVLIGGLSGGLLLGLIGGLRSGLLGILIGGLLFGLFFSGEAFVKHLVLRAILTRAGHMPWRYAGFLDYATELILLRKVGGGYIFIHRALLEYFATLDD